MAAGGALVSSPIIIHLINRMRFKRIRWAAMEFLLKSQKRNRRRLIIEQLILLLLRILLVLLAAFLLARFIGQALGILQPQATLHVVLLDDTPSMGDQWRDGDQAFSSFQQATSLITDRIAKNALQATSVQTLELIRLSDLSTSRRYDRLNRQEADRLRRDLSDWKATPLHVPLLDGVRKARAIFLENTHEQRYLYIVSDFRQRDWSGPETEAVVNELKSLMDGKVEVRMLDVAHPYRQRGEDDTIGHDNLAITDLRPESRVAARNMPVRMHLTISNHSNRERQNVRVQLQVNGSPQPDALEPLPSVPPGETHATAQVTFNQLGFNQVTANLEHEDTGLQIDDIRYAVVEVREQVPILLVDGDPANSSKPGGDRYHLQTLFDRFSGAVHGFEIVGSTPYDLEQSNLSQYPSIYLVNVRELSDKAVENLRAYVREGGSLAFFLGERVNPTFYNEKLFQDGKGLFPAPLAARPNPPLSEENAKSQFLGKQTQILARNDSHPIVADIWEFHQRFGVLSQLTIGRYFPVQRDQWRPDPAKVEELMTLPNRGTVDDYRDNVLAVLADLPTDRDDYRRYRPGLLRHEQAIRTALAGQPLYQLGIALDDLLRDAGEENNPERPNLTELWRRPELASLRGRIDRLRETVQYGDPLLITNRYGKGRVVALLTTVGKGWNDWAGGSAASLTYPVLMIEMQRWLTGQDREEILAVGQTLEMQMDGTRFDPRVRRFFMPEPKEGQVTKLAGAGAEPIDPQGSNLVDRGEQIAAVGSDGQLILTFNEARQPGIYLFEFAPRPGVDDGFRMETKAFAFNIDTRAESDLQRASRAKLQTAAGNAPLQTVEIGADADQARTADLSRTPWLFLLFLILLVAEQALAVHLSFHLRGSEAATPPSFRLKPAE